eukprot:gene12892-biopygen21521
MGGAVRLVVRQTLSPMRCSKLRKDGRNWEAIRASELAHDVHAISCCCDLPHPIPSAHLSLWRPPAPLPPGKSGGRAPAGCTHTHLSMIRTPFLVTFYCTVQGICPRRVDWRDTHASACTLLLWTSTIQFNYPGGVAVVGGEVFVTDQGNHRARGARRRERGVPPRVRLEGQRRRRVQQLRWRAARCSSRTCTTTASRCTTPRAGGSFVRSARRAAATASSKARAGSRWRAA